MMCHIIPIKIIQEKQLFLKIIGNIKAQIKNKGCAVCMIFFLICIYFDSFKGSINKYSIHPGSQLKKNYVKYSHYF